MVDLSTSSDERPENKSRTSRFKEGHFVPYTEVKEIHPNSENEGKERISCPNHTKSHRNELKDQYPHSQNEKESYFNQSESKEILSHIESEDGIVKDEESKNRLPNHSDFGSQKRNDPSLTQSQKRSESKIPLKDPKFQKRNDPKSQNGNEGFSSQKRIDPKSLNEPSGSQSQSRCKSNMTKNQNEFNTSQNHLSTQNRTEPTQNRTESTQNRTESSQNRCEPIALYENLFSGGVIPQYESNNVDQLYGNVTWGDEPYVTDKSDRDGLERSDGFWSDLNSRKSHWNESNSRNGEFNSRNHQSSELDSKKRSFSALEMETDSKGRYWSELDSRNGELNPRNGKLDSRSSHWTNTDSRNGGIDSRNSGIDSRNGEFDSRNGEFDSRNGEFDSRNGEFDSRNGEFDSRNRPWSESNFKELEKRNSNGSYWNNLDKNGDCRDVLSSEMENRDRLWSDKDKDASKDSLWNEMDDRGRYWSDKDKDTSKDSLWNEMEDRGRYWSDKDGDREEEEGEIECLQEDFSYELSSRGMR
ncbi:GATA zinc finger domain-containing protein 14-like [Diaphorina citri]|uniref:GATA zinc finger domain-containing protein 14-like n=1 Tax=Diaphorina citri TaxID=121845 RepID=A0A1S4EQE0_DIACI|nr:GATA zinc finger domain-containing protein 14-like [Diaphorina citri]